MEDRVSQSRGARLGVAAFAIASAVVVPGVASAEPDPPRPFCKLYWRDRTISSSDGTVPDITYREPYWVC